MRLRRQWCLNFADGVRVLVQTARIETPRSKGRSNLNAAPMAEFYYLAHFNKGFIDAFIPQREQTRQREVFFFRRGLAFVPLGEEPSLAFNFTLGLHHSDDYHSIQFYET